VGFRAGFEKVALDKEAFVAPLIGAAARGLAAVGSGVLRAGASVGRGAVSAGRGAASAGRAASAGVRRAGFQAMNSGASAARNVQMASRSVGSSLARGMNNVAGQGLNAGMYALSGGAPKGIMRPVGAALALGATMGDFKRYNNMNQSAMR